MGHDVGICNSLELFEDEVFNFYDNFDIALLYYDIKNNQIIVSARFKELCGLTTDDVVHKADIWNEIIHPDDHAYLTSLIDKLLQGQTTKSRFRIIRPDGEVRWVEERGKHKKNENNEVVGVYSVIIDITEQVTYEKALQESKEELLQSKNEIENIFNNNTSCIWSNDHINNKITLSKGIEDLYGYTEQEFNDNVYLWFECIHPEDRQKGASFYRKLLTGTPDTSEWRYISKNGETKWAQVMGNAIFDSTGKVVKINGIVYDITERKRLEEELKQAKDELQKIIDNVDVGIYKADENFDIVYVSKNIEKVWGIPEEIVLDCSTSWEQIIHQEDLKMVRAEINKVIKGQPYIMEYRIKRMDSGKIRWIEERCTPVFTGSSQYPTEFHGVVIDITDRKLAEEKVKHMAYHDNLTGLPNREMFNKYLQKAIARCKRKNKKLAVLFIDLDRFKFINDTKGHDSGDVLLKQVSKRLVKCIREADIVARQGGDEFIILIEDTEATDVREICERILKEFITPFTLGNEEFYSSPSIGISIYPDDGLDKVSLIKHADTAMYVAKKRGKNTYQFYIPEDEAVVDRKTKLEQGIKRALHNGEFTLHYQPKVNIKTKEIYAVEALLRWNHPYLGSISPTEFIPIAEETGMILAIGKWVLEEACIQNKTWQQAGFRIKVAVNVSPVQVIDSRFVDTVKETLANTGLLPELLGLEITESVMQNVEQSTMVIQELKKIGVKISIDDFGTGYSSLGRLNKLPIDLVKIDKSFVSEITKDVNAASLVKTIIEMGKNLSFDLIAEGIETKEQAEFLIEHGCFLGQGYLYSPPLPANEIEELLEDQFRQVKA